MDHYGGAQGIDILSVTGSDCFVEFPPMLAPDQMLGKEQVATEVLANQIVDINDIQMIDAGSVEADGPFGINNAAEAGSAKETNGEQKKEFYETAKFNPRQLIDLVDQSMSSCNEAEEEAHLPEVQAFSRNSRMRMRSIMHVDLESQKIA